LCDDFFGDLEYKGVPLLPCLFLAGTGLRISVKYGDGDPFIHPLYGKKGILYSS
jgi:hypothetical protein